MSSKKQTNKIQYYLTYRYKIGLFVTQIPKTDPMTIMFYHKSINYSIKAFFSQKYCNICLNMAFCCTKLTQKDLSCIYMVHVKNQPDDGPQLKEVLENTHLSRCLEKVFTNIIIIQLLLQSRKNINRYVTILLLQRAGFPLRNYDPQIQLSRLM